MIRNQEAIMRLLVAQEKLAELIQRTANWKIETHEDLQVYSEDMNRVKYWLSDAKYQLTKQVTYT